MKNKYKEFFELLKGSGSHYVTQGNSVVVLGYLFLNRSTSLVTLPERLSVAGSLGLEGCTSLTNIPDGLKVGNDLFLRYCTSLKKLPDGLSVGGDLYLDECRLYPFDVKVGGKIYGDYEIIHNSKRFISDE